MSWVILLRLVLKLKGSGLVIITLVSSANRTNLELTFVNWGRSFMYRRKSSGPSIDPCGTPYVTSPQCEHE